MTLITKDPEIILLWRCRLTHYGARSS